MIRDHCGACGCQLQPLEPTSSWAKLAAQEAAVAGLRDPDPLLLAQVVHVGIVHCELEALPPLLTVDQWTRKGGPSRP